MEEIEDLKDQLETEQLTNVELYACFGQPLSCFASLSWHQYSLWHAD